jgi:hypothetical protein
MGTGADDDRGHGPARRTGRRPGILGRFVGGLLIGVGTIFGSKADQDQLWAVPPTMQVLARDEQAGIEGPSGADQLPATT